MIGRCYLLNGDPVVVVTQWGLKSRGETYGGPRNVRILFPDGTTTIRPFRGLRRLRLRETVGLPANEELRRRVLDGRRGLVREVPRRYRQQSIRTEGGSWVILRWTDLPGYPALTPA